MLTWIMLNPSTATADTDDATIRKCVGFSKRLGYGSLAVVNLFAFRATKPADMRKAEDPIGEMNDYFIKETLKYSGMVICAWGAHGHFKERDKAMMELLSSASVTPYCLTVTKDGFPGHPVMLGYNNEPKLYHGRKDGQVCP